MKYPVGTAVKIAKTCQYYGLTNKQNPSDVRGVVSVALDSLECDTRVHWDNGTSNSYWSATDLVLWEQGPVIGYKLLKDTPTMLKDTVIMVDGEGEYRGVSRNTGNRLRLNADDMSLQPEWFEALYETPSREIKLSNGSIAVVDAGNDGNIVFNGGGETVVTKAELRELKKSLAAIPPIGGHSFALQTFRLGCQSFDVSDLVSVFKAIQIVG